MIPCGTLPSSTRCWTTTLIRPHPHRVGGRLIAFIRQQDLEVEWLLETHCACRPSLGRRLPAQERWREDRHRPPLPTSRRSQGNIQLEPQFHPDAAFRPPLQDGETFEIGELRAEAMSVPGHTPACWPTGRRRGLTGDTLFMPDVGTAVATSRGNARTLYHSVRKLLSLPLQTLVHVPDYPPRGAFLHGTTVPRSAQAKFTSATGWAKRSSCSCVCSATRLWRCRP